MEWHAPSSGVAGAGPIASLPSASNATQSAYHTRPVRQPTPPDAAAVSLALVATGEAMDVVAGQCEHRGLTSTATWLAEMSLHALPSVLAVPLPAASPLVTVVRALDVYAVRSAVVPASTTPAQLHYQRLHRVALGYFTKGEYQRCHQTILREIMRGSESAATGSQTAVNGASAAMPSPETVRGFRTTTVPPLLQFLSLYALFMDGMRVKQLGNNANVAAASGGSGGGGSQRAVHPHARVLRAYLLEAMRNPTNALRSHNSTEVTSAAVAAEEMSPSHPLPSRAHHALGSAVESQGEVPAQAAAAAAAVGAAPSLLVADGWDPHTPSAKRQPWTITSASRAPPVGSAGRAAVTPAEGASSSSVGSQAFSNISPGTHMKPSAGSPTVASPAQNATAAAAAAAADGMVVGSSDLLHVDPYLTWLMGVVLRELRMRQECATYLLAAVTVNPLLRCAWEDLTSLVSRETQLAELDAALDGVEPHFMMDIFAAEVRGLLGVAPVSTSRLRHAAAGVLDASAPRQQGGAPDTAATASTSSPLPPPSSVVSAPSTASLTNAWECLGCLFPDTPHLLSQLAHFHYHQRNRLDRAEAIYQRIRVLDPHYYAILYDYSNVLYTRRDQLGLSSLVQSVYHADAFRAETNFAVGNYYVLLGQHDRAALHFHRTTAIDPQCAEAWLLLGHAYVEVKNTSAAVEAYRAAVELNERDYRGWYNLGQIYELLEAYHHALYYYWHTTSLRPADPGMWVAVANCLEHDGRMAESIACLERAETYDVSTSPNYPAYVRRIATHHIANSSFTRACVYLEKLAQSSAATGEDLLLALPFLIQHYIQRARKSMELSARSSSYDPALFPPGVNVSPASSPASAVAGRTALHHARAAAALQHLHKAEEHLGAMAELVLPGGASDGVAPEGESSSSPMAGLENYTDDTAGSTSGGRRRSKQSLAGPEQPPPVAFVRSRHQEVSLLKAQAMQLLQPPPARGQPSSTTSVPASASSAAAASVQQLHQRSFFAPHTGKRS